MLEHIGFIVDGNRRWARERGLPTLEGHRRGFNKVEKIAEALIDRHIKFASFYLFSTENWGRSPEEVEYLMNLARKHILRLAKKLKKKGAKLIILGKKDPVPEDLWQKMQDAEELTKNGENGTICVCFNYGGHQEIADACTKLLKEKVTSVSPDDIEHHLYHPEVPPCDLIVRTSGEERISGFMLWRAAYAEFLFLKKFFPDIDIPDLDDIFAEFDHRERRFGK